MGEHRVPMLSASLRRYPDPEFSADPRTRRLLGGLRALAPAHAPSPAFRAELRAQLVAVAPRLVTEVHAAPIPRARQPIKVEGSQFVLPGRLRAAYHGALSISIGRPVAILTAVVAVFAMLLGSAVYMSKQALPGDALYSLKRANESVQLSLADNSVAKGKDYLDFATTRANEVQDLLKRVSAQGAGPSAASAINAHTASLITDTLAAADSDVRDAAQLLGRQAVDQSSASPLSALTGWAPSQMARLQTITAELPAGAVHDRAATSSRLVTAASDRAAALSSMASCGCLATAPTDSLGPLPCAACAVAPPASGAPGAGSVVPNLPSTGPGVLVPSTGRPSLGAATTGSGTASAAPSAGQTTAPTQSRAAPPAVLPNPVPSLSVPSQLPVVGSTSGSARCLITVLGVCVHL
ncbi:MAG: DUF5667 domain-containing protein [Actinomycetota bacterium]|nr:DUF5667 domain-containing protein [Actinomycetota bacterium]